MDSSFPLEDTKKKIQDILEEPEIRFCGLIDSEGELLAGDMKPGIVPLETDKDRRKIYSQLAHRAANRSGFDANFGRVKYSSSRREKVVMISFPIGRYILLVIAEPSVNIDRLAWKIIYKLDHQWSEYYGF